MSEVLLIKSKQEMSEFAKSLTPIQDSASGIQKIICLNGTLGMGKTFFAKEFIGSLLDEKEEVTSPTFNLLNIYDTKLGEIFHFDLYRLKNEDELENIGFFDAIKNGICLIEWPQVAKQYLTNYVNVEIKTNNLDNPEEREVVITHVNNS